METSTVSVYCCTNPALLTVLWADAWLDDTVACAKRVVATEAAIAFFCWLLLPEVTFTPRLPEAFWNALPPRLAALVTPAFMVSLNAPC